MLKLFIAFTLAVLAVGPAEASDEADVISVIHRWVDGFNSGDTKLAVAACADQTSLIDDFPPHEWQGRGACAKWFSDFQAMSKSYGSTQHVIAVGKPAHIEISTDFAYIVAPTTLSFERAGKPVKDQGLLTVTLRNDASGWRITGWVWSDQ